MAETGGTTRTVLVATAANGLIAVAKGVAAVLTGSAALLAETLHSVADTANEVLLFVGLRRSERRVDPEHPFGWGQERYFWSLLAAVGIFVVGGVASVYEGVRALREPEPLGSVWPGVAVLVLSAALEGWSWRTARRELSGDAARRRMSRRRFMQVSSDPAATTVYLEDSAALVGIALALSALLLHAATGDAVWDGLASILIGLLLVAVAFVLVRRNQALLVDTSAPQPLVDDLRRVVGAHGWVREVPALSAVWIGPRRLLVVVDVRVDPEGPAAGLVQDVARLREELLHRPYVARAEVTPVP
ncbi:cation diffusion facilitator family transporter [Vallicoccus soli]|uniref:Cation diffusion facilitator family transporter n=1 Tax=Vallicoccus soli TaxID=2339232 RepID=A0A3A3Z2D3_9ACTN|nr:cation diffusion facilitator family transporter [Vallicoccus soli]RJK97542.1 cation diffusion facilitator family transporter [Vallicoccus soli]